MKEEFEQNACCECEHCEHNHEHLHEHEPSCACGCEHCERAAQLDIEDSEEENESKAFIIIKIAVSAVLMFLGILPLFDGNIKLAFFIASAIVSGYELFPEALEELKNKKLGENLLMLIAIIAAFSIGEGFVGLVVRVVKNVFEKAIEIKDENDLVI